MLPNFIIIGSKKCASTALHNYLGQHPEIYTSKIKETGFFSYKYKEGMEFYSSYFKEAGGRKIIGECTPTYCFLPYVAERIKEHFPDIKLILCIRNPVERAYSDWLMQSGMGKETLSFDASMDICKKMLNETRDKLAKPGGKKSRQYTEEEEEQKPRTHIIAGLYSEMLKLYLKHFKREQIKIIIFEELMSDLDVQLSHIFSFLGADPGFIVPDKKSINFSYDRIIPKLIISIFGKKRGKNFLQHIPQNFKSVLKKKMKKPSAPKLSAEQRLKYWDYFKDDVAEVEKLLQIDLSHWDPAKYSNNTI